MRAAEDLRLSQDPCHRTRQLSDRERIDRLRLIRSDHVGPVTYRRLVARFGSAAAALRALPALARRGGARVCSRVFSEAEAEAELAALAAAGGRLVACDEADYPPLLAHIDDAPPLLAVIGETALARRPMVAIVGARNASINGRRLAGMLAHDLGAAGVTIVSGLARGIDEAAHAAALSTGTVAVVAGGVDVVYPEENRDLQRAIAEQGLIVSEFPPALRPQARHFPRRNRLISGACQAVVVVEASLRSGSLITARTALEQGREVLAVPGSPLDPRSRGANDLIRQGAALVEAADDVLRVIAEPPMAATTTLDHPAQVELDLFDDDAVLADAREIIGQALSATPASVDEIVRSCQLSPSLVNTILLEWELAGRLERHPGNKIAMIAFAKS